jgi:hypothetical protein
MYTYPPRINTYTNQYCLPVMPEDAMLHTAAIQQNPVAKLFFITVYPSTT